MIKSFADKVTAAVFAGLEARRLAKPLQAAARRKLMMLDAATTLDTLRATPGNRLEALKGNLAGYHSIRINQQWRIVFKWDDGAREVQIVDYH